MKKPMIFLLAGFLLCAGCASEEHSPSIRAGYRGTFEQISSEDAAAVQTLIGDIMKEDLPALQEDEHYIGGFPHIIRIDRNGEILTYIFMYDTLSIAYPEQTHEEYKLPEQLYQEKVYPELSRIMEEYLPLTYQLYSPFGISLHVSGAPEEADEESLSLMISELFQTMPQWAEADLYGGVYEDEIAYAEFSDTVITETIHLFSDFMVIRDRILPYTDPGFPETFLNSLNE